MPVCSCLCCALAVGGAQPVRWRTWLHVGPRLLRTCRSLGPGSPALRVTRLDLQGLLSLGRRGGKGSPDVGGCTPYRGHSQDR